MQAKNKTCHPRPQGTDNATAVALWMHKTLRVARLWRTQLGLSGSDMGAAAALLADLACAASAQAVKERHAAFLARMRVAQERFLSEGAPAARRDMADVSTRLHRQTLELLDAAAEMAPVGVELVKALPHLQAAEGALLDAVHEDDAVRASLALRGNSERTRERPLVQLCAVTMSRAGLDAESIAKFVLEKFPGHARFYSDKGRTRSNLRHAIQQRLSGFGDRQLLDLLSEFAPD